MWGIEGGDGEGRKGGWGGIGVDVGLFVFISYRRMEQKDVILDRPLLS